MNKFKCLVLDPKYNYCELVEIDKESENGEIDLAKSTIMETRKYLAKEILHCDIDIFLRTILLSSD